MKPWLVAQDLGRWYGDVVGLSDLTVTLEDGMIGLLGPNGAGKSTLLKLIAGEIKPSRGSLAVLGHAPFANRSFFRDLGFCPQQDALYGDMSAFDFVTHMLRLRGWQKKEARALAVEALERVALTADMHRKCQGYSKGMRQRVKIAQAIAHRPPLVVVDEPLTGLDPVARAETLALFRELHLGGVRILFSSHVLHEVEALTSHVLLLHRGRLLAQGAIHEIRTLLERQPRKLVLRAREARKLARALFACPSVHAVRLNADGDGLAVETFDLDDLFRRLPAIAAAERAGIQTMESPDAGLEAIFDYLVP